MKTTAFGNAAFALAVLGAVASSALGASVTYVAGPSDLNGSSTISAITPTYTYTTNLGYAFKTGSSGTFDIDWIKLGLTSGVANGSGSFKISLHNTNNAIAYSAVADTTEYAADTVSFTTPSTANTAFELTLTSGNLPTISAYSLLPDTVYALFVNSQSGSGIALRRKQGLANGTTNDAYTVTNGFTMLDTFRNNTPNYANSQGPPVSYAAFAISFGGEVSAVPETSNMAFLAVLVGSGLVRRHRARR
jgi:hypothetical protein